MTSADVEFANVPRDVLPDPSKIQYENSYDLELQKDMMQRLQDFYPNTIDRAQPIPVPNSFSTKWDKQTGEGIRSQTTHLLHR